MINTKNSNIASISETDYLDTIYAELIEQYSFDVTNAAIYYTFNDHSILHACDEFQKYISDQGINFNIDDFSSTNIHIFNKEEKYYEEKCTYFLFSVMSYVLFDLGIIRE